jgi:hypothetical protein
MIKKVCACLNSSIASLVNYLLRLEVDYYYYICHLKIKDTRKLFALYHIVEHEKLP